MTFIPSTPYARLVAKEKGVDISKATPTGMFGAVRSQDVLLVAQKAGRVTPLARKMAEVYGLNIEEVKGTGFDGKVRKADVLAMVETQNAQKQQTESTAAPQMAGRREKMRGMRKVIAQRMLQSHLEIPPVTHNVKNDVTALVEARKKLNANSGKKYSVNDFVLLAVTKALMAHPNVLVSIEGDEMVYKDSVNIGMAVAVDSGLIVPVIKNAQDMNLDTLSSTAKDLATRARNNKLMPDEYKGSSFSVSNLGMYDVETFTPIINQPDAAILGVCAIQDELVIVEGAVTVRKMMRTSLTYDHRSLDGATAAKFQQKLKHLLENPIELFM